MMRDRLFPYLENESRLVDIIAAIQVMGSYPKFTSRGADKWKDKLDDPVSADSWETVCGEHPEFFRVSESGGKKYLSLRWRWALDTDFLPEMGRSLTSVEIKQLTAQQKDGLTKPPLEPPQIETLINAAIALHARAIEHERQKKWWVPIIIPAITALIGAALGFVGAWIGKK